MVYSKEEDEKYFALEYKLLIREGSLLHVALSWWSILPGTRVGYKWRTEFPENFKNWLKYLVAIEVSLQRLPGDKAIQEARESALTGVEQCIEGIKAMNIYYSNLKERRLWPQGHSDLATNKFVMEVSQLIKYQNGAHRGKTKWTDVKRLATYYINLDADKFGFLKSISSQKEGSLKSKIRKFRLTLKNQRPLYSPPDYLAECRKVFSK